MNPSDSAQRVQELLAPWMKAPDQGTLPSAAELCRDCPELMPQVQQYIEQFMAGKGPASTETLPDPRTVDAPTPPLPRAAGLPARAGRYVVEEKIGEGGMGAVLRVRDPDIGRTLAVKVMLPRGGAQEQAAARFLAEAKLTGQLQHPGIPPVHELGRLENGLPFFAMKLIEGQTLAGLLKARRASADGVGDKAGPAGDLPRLLNIFKQICQTIGYAHSRGVIHRDLKPGNIMVGSFGEVQVMDWGLAKFVRGKEAAEATASGSAEAGGTVAERGKAGLSQAGDVLGTPAYMAPEQARGEIDRVDARSDVFGLGAILCEMLTGRPPFAEGGAMQMLRMAADGDLAGALGRLEGCGADVELVGLCKRCLAAVREERPADGGAVAEAVEAYEVQVQERLRRAEIDTARAQTRALEERRRRRVQLIATAVVLGVLAAGIIGTTIGLIQANSAAEAERVAKLAAQKRQEQIKKGSDILASIFEDLDPFKIEKGEKKLELVLGERLKDAAAQLKGEAIGDPLLVAELQNTLGNSLIGVGYFPEAIVVLEECRATREKLLGSDHHKTLTAMGNLANAYQVAGKLDLALPLFEASHKLMKASLGPYHPNTLSSINNLAAAYREAGKLDLALPLLEESFKLSKANLGPDHLGTLFSMGNLAAAYSDAGKRDLALPLTEETHKLIKVKLGLSHPYTLESMNNLATAYRSAGKLDLALPLMEETLKLRKAMFGPDHAKTLFSMLNLATAYRSAGKLDLALPLMEETLKLIQAKLGPDHPESLRTMDELAEGYLVAGKLDLALPLWEKTLKLSQAKLGSDHTQKLRTMGKLAEGYRVTGKLDLALPLMEETLKLSQAKQGPDHPNTLALMGQLAAGYSNANKLELALPLMEETLKLHKAKCGPDHPNTLTSMGNLAVGYQLVGKLDLALPLFEETLKLRKAKLGPDHFDTLGSMSNLAAAYRSAGKLDLALPLLEETLKHSQAKLGPDHPTTLIIMVNMALGYRDAGKLDLALPLLEETLKLSQAKLGPDHPNTQGSMNYLAEVYQAGGKLDLALSLFEETLKLTKSKYGPDHRDTIIGMNNLAAAYRAASKRELPFLYQYLKTRQQTASDSWTTFLVQALIGGKLLAQQKYQEAEVPLHDGYLGMKKREETIPPPCREFLREAAQNLVRLYEATDRNDEAKKWAAVVAGLSVHSGSKEAGLPAGVLFQKGLAHLRTGAFGEAEPLLRKAVKMLQKQEPDNWATFHMQSLLGQSLVGQKKHKDAEPLLLSAYAGMKVREKTIPPQQRDLALQHGMGALADLFEATRRQKEESKLPGNLTDEKKQAVHEIKLTAGMAAVLLMNSGQFDTLLQLADEKGNVLAVNDDIDYAAKKTNSRIWFMPQTDGVYRIVGTSYQQQGRGDYEIVIRQYAEKAK